MQESDFQFLGYRISTIDCNIQDTFGVQPEKFQQSIDIGNNFFEKDKRRVEVILKINVNSESKLFSFGITIKGMFKANEDMTDELFQKLSKENGPAILYPFARGIIASYTAQANILPIVLPLMNFSE